MHVQVERRRERSHLDLFVEAEVNIFLHQEKQKNEKREKNEKKYIILVKKMRSSSLKILYRTPLHCIATTLNNSGTPILEIPSLHNSRCSNCSTVEF